jgi:geranylgeranyl pyrophosphate synthase
MNMEKALYRQLMLETSREVSPLLVKSLKPLKVNPQLHKTCIELIAKRRNKFMVRSYLARFSYSAVSLKNWKSILDFCAAVEIELVSMYYCNRIFDGKGGKEVQNHPNNQFVASMLTRDTASQMLSYFCKNIPPKKQAQISDLFNESNSVSYIGQFIDMNDAIYSPNLKLDEKQLTDLYLRRCYGTNAHYFEAIGKISAILADGTEAQIKALGEFGKNYGIALQIVNDISDFVPPEEGLSTSEKIPEDAYADLINGKLTYPIIYTLTKGKNSDKRSLIMALTKRMKKKEMVKITRLLAQNGAFSASKRLARQYARKAHNAIKIFEKEKRRPLSLMCVMLMSNRYYKALEKYA